MYSSVVNGMASTSKIASVSQKGASQNSQNLFAVELAEALKSAANSASEGVIQASEGTRKLSPVDAAVQGDLKTAFGIEPHRPGDPLQPLVKSMWALQDLDNNGIISGSEMETNLAAASDIFQKHLSRFIRSENVSTQPPIELSIASDGRVRVQNDHPDKEKIEKHINGNSELRNLYVGISSSRDMLAMAEESMKFQKRYAVDPRAAVAEFAHLFSGNYGYRTKLTIDGENWNYQTSSSFTV